MQKREKHYGRQMDHPFLRDGWIFGCLRRSRTGIPGRPPHSLAAAAVAGGYTGVAVMPSTHPALQTKADIEYIIHKTAGKSG